MVCIRDLKTLFVLKYFSMPPLTSGLPPWHTRQRWHRSRWLPWPQCLMSVLIPESQTTLLAHHVATMRGARGKLHGETKHCGPGSQGAKMSCRLLIGQHRSRDLNTGLWLAGRGKCPGPVTTVIITLVTLSRGVRSRGRHWRSKHCNNVNYETAPSKRI